jgi:hypothetical protein
MKPFKIKKAKLLETKVLFQHHMHSEAANCCLMYARTYCIKDEQYVVSFDLLAFHL